MLFNSLYFIIFLSIILPLYYILPQKLKWILLLISSYIFYMFWRVEFIFLILFSSFINYFLAKKIYNNKSKKILVLGIIINFTILFIFKYLVFFSNIFKSFYNFFNLNYPINDFDIILPMGISFYTFQATSYIIDIYRGRYKPENNFFKFSLYIAFFPQLVAGPIERADNLLNQLFIKKHLNIKNISIGLKIMLIGYFKKIVIADRLSTIVNTIYATPKDFSGIYFIIATIFFSFQIYCDFSGYSDIAIGCSKLFGIDLMQNFDSPYFSKSIKEFWKRWHISLSSWFKDYLYIPLGGNRCSKFKNYLNILITFTISGLWHGANWTFIFWGMLHGFYQIIGDIKNQLLLKIKVKKQSNIFFDFFKVIFIFLIVNYAWIFFRANSILDAFYISSNLFNDINNIFNIQYMYNVFNNLGLNFFEIFLVIISIIMLILWDKLNKKVNVHLFLYKFNFIIRFIVYYILVIVILCFGVFNNAGEFIYFQF